MPGITHYLRSIINTTIGRAPDGYSGAVDYHAGYRAKIVAQSQDLATVDVVTDSPLFSRSGMQAIPVRWGVPGVDAALSPGAYVTLLHDEGDASRPYVVACDPWSTQQTTDLRLGGGSLPVARLGDVVVGTIDMSELAIALLSCYSLSGTTGGPIISGPLAAAKPVTITGVITTGATVTKAG